jgi:hypothetical protein
MWENIKKGGIQSFAREAISLTGLPVLIMSTLIGFGVALVSWFSDLKPITIFVFGIGVFAFVLIILVESRKVYEWWENRNLSQEADEYVSLSEAAKTVYSDLRERGDSAHVRMADMEANTEETLNYMAIAISNHSQLYGKHPPSDRLEAIQQRHYWAGTFQNSGDTFSLHGNHEIFFENCAIRKSDIEDAIAQLAEIKV